VLVSDHVRDIYGARWLSNGGDDSIQNAVALCPNCHRKMHALNRKADIKKLTLKAMSETV
jgi:5-methylcytosine-specific restriction protein A